MDPFFSALTKYLQDNKYSNGDTQGLWQSMADSSGLPVLQWMQRWASQQGVPLVSAARSEDGTKLQLAQQVISLGMHEGPQHLVCGTDLATPLELPGGAADNPSSDGVGGGLMVAPAKYAWWIPVTYAPVDASGNSTVATGVVDSEGVVEMKDCEAEAPWPEGATAIKVNSGQWGVFRVNYTEELWEGLIQAAPSLSPEDLSGVLADSYSLGMSGVVPLSYFLRFAASLPARSHFAASTLAETSLPLAPDATTAPDSDVVVVDSSADSPADSPSSVAHLSAEEYAQIPDGDVDDSYWPSAPGAVAGSGVAFDARRRLQQAAGEGAHVPEGENAVWRALKMISKVLCQSANIVYLLVLADNKRFIILFYSNQLVLDKFLLLDHSCIYLMRVECMIKCGQ